MKQLYAIFLFAFLLFFLSKCRSPEYYIKHEKPDEAFRFAIKRVKGKKQKTKHLQTLEYGYNVANERDIALVNNYKQNDDLNSWKKIHYLNQLLLFRQEKLEPYLPLVSEEGYRPYFKSNPVKEWEDESFWKVTELYLKEIRNLLVLAEKGEKLQARKANLYLHKLVSEHGYDAPELSILEDSTYMLGTTYFLMDIYGLHGNWRSNEIINWVMGNGFSLKNKWKEIHLTPYNEINYDFVVEVKITSEYVSGDNVSSSCRRYSKEIEVGKKEIKDTSGNVTYEPIFETVHATVQEFDLSKSANIQADLIISNPKTGQTILTKRICGTDSFSDSYCVISGDARATDKCCSGRGDSFPSDKYMLKCSANSLRYSVLRYLKRVDVSR